MQMSYFLGQSATLAFKKNVLYDQYPPKWANWVFIAVEKREPLLGVWWNCETQDGSQAQTSIRLLRETEAQKWSELPVVFTKNQVFGFQAFQRMPPWYPFLPVGVVMLLLPVSVQWISGRFFSEKTFSTLCEKSKLLPIWFTVLV